MTYDLRRLRLAGLIQRLPRSNRHQLTSDQPQAPPEIGGALRTLDRRVADYIDRARLRAAA